MTDESHLEGTTAIDEGAWVYLIASAAGSEAADPLRDRIVEVCEAGGWSAISWPPADSELPSDPGHLFEGVRHAVEHADCVVALLGTAADAANAELALAYSHRRPIIGVLDRDGHSYASEAAAMLGSYDRARVIACTGVEECVDQLRAVLGDPDFAATIRHAAGEHASSA